MSYIDTAMCHIYIKVYIYIYIYIYICHIYVVTADKGSHILYSGERK